MNDLDPIELAMRVVQRTIAESEESEAIVAEPAADLVREILEQPPQEIIGIGGPGLPSPSGNALPRPAPKKEKKAADQLAAMILDDLSRIAGCPKRGVRVTVYGSNPWNSWLSFGADAGPVLNKAYLQDFCAIITERLKRLYDV